MSGSPLTIIPNHSHCTVVSFITAEILMSDKSAVAVKTDEGCALVPELVTLVVVEAGAELDPLAPPLLLCPYPYEPSP